jgi:hypothetical protein
VCRVPDHASHCLGMALRLLEHVRRLQSWIGGTELYKVYLLQDRRCCIFAAVCALSNAVFMDGSF